MSEVRYEVVQLRPSTCEHESCSMPATHGLALKDIGWLWSRYCELHANERAAYCTEQLRR